MNQPITGLPENLTKIDENTILECHRKLKGIQETLTTLQLYYNKSEIINIVLKIYELFPNVHFLLIFFSFGKTILF